MSDVQNIVIIGGVPSPLLVFCRLHTDYKASVAGHTLANELLPSLPTSHRILIIDASDFTYWPVGGLRAAVQPGTRPDLLRLHQD